MLGMVSSSRYYASFEFTVSRTDTQLPGSRETGQVPESIRGVFHFYDNRVIGTLEVSKIRFVPIAVRVGASRSCRGVW